MTNWYWLRFDQFTPLQLYKALQLREAIFTREQKCTLADIDDIDLNALVSDRDVLGHDRNATFALQVI